MSLLSKAQQKALVKHWQRAEHKRKKTMNTETTTGFKSVALTLTPEQAEELAKNVTFVTTDEETETAEETPTVH